VSLSPELYEAILRIVDQRVGEIKVTREDFEKLARTVSELSEIVSKLSGTVSELSVTVRELAEAQKRTEQRIGELTEAQKRIQEHVSELTEAQKRTEQRIGELTEAQKRIQEHVSELTEAQKRTEGRIRELAQAQEKTEERISELAEAQKRTEEGLGNLATAVGRLSDTVGYGLEDVAMVILPSWLERNERIRVEELERRFMEIEGESVEVNLYGVGLKGRTQVTIIGEAKSRIHAGDVKEFAEKLQKVRKALGERRVISLMFGYWVHPEASSIAKAFGIRVIASYQR